MWIWNVDRSERCRVRARLHSVEGRGLGSLVLSIYFKIIILHIDEKNVRQILVAHIVWKNYILHLSVLPGQRRDDRLSLDSISFWNFIVLGRHRTEGYVSVLCFFVAK